MASRTLPLFLLFILLMTGAQPLEHVKREISEKNSCQGSDCTRYEVNLSYPEFQTADPQQTISSLNAYLKGLCDDQCNEFIQYVRESYSENSTRTTTQKSTCHNQFEIQCATKTFVSMIIVFSFTYPDEINLHNNNVFFINYDLKNGVFLNVKDCFSFKKSPQEWAKFVDAEEFVALSQGEEMPQDFMMNEWGVVFVFKASQIQYRFPWEEVAQYFEISSLVPKDIYQ